MGAHEDARDDTGPPEGFFKTGEVSISVFAPFPETIQDFETLKTA